jgi:hypothetical protein
MRKVIKGKLYDTETAQLIATWHDGYPSDFRYTREALYRKRTGEYFLHGEGGAMSPYAKSCGQNQWMGGEVIRPLAYGEARMWMEQKAEADGYESEFGLPDEDAEHDMHVIISETAWQAISRAATSEGVTVRAIVERLASTL